MSAHSPNILALDFDGVICDGLAEYFATTKKTYEQIWSGSQLNLIDNLAPSFYCLRPVIETGWEMPILLRALVLGIEEDKILNNWLAIAKEIIQSEGLNSKEISKQLDTIRDNWIDTDLEGWLQLHRFYPGIIKRLQQILVSPTQLYIITTKEGRFAQQLLQQQGIELSSQQIIGKEYKRPKYETLRLLKDSTTIEELSIWFVEDRFKTLQLVQQQQDLQSVQLFLADWGYNTKSEREAARYDPNIQLLSLEQFQQNFTAW
ncbi:HAD hydrolase-like protein [Pleurocapsales cyanobacterium LEGE 06147]|nr:HAD hydrolase-like protein [Pleurocapsales cyanobacterium LEGE 06147]